jgi:ABC-type antimicrobial peptide transport system permease subunit
MRRRADATAVMLSVPGVSAASPELFLRDSSIEYRGNRQWCSLIGATDGIMPIGNHELAAGRFICDMDRKSGARVVVLGASVAADLFGAHAPALLRRVYIRGVPFRVIGVMRNYELVGMGGRGGGFMQWKNRFTFVPLETVIKRLGNGEDLSSLNFEVRDSLRLAKVAEAIRNTLFFLNRRIINFSVRTNEEMLDRFSEISGAFSISLGIIAGISLLVGGIGIMNIMLASINERIREIGIRKAIGARERDIMTQVLVEAVVLSLVGGVLGVCMSLFLTQTIGAIISNTFSKPVVRMGPLVFSFGVSVVIGIAFGLYPAFKAAKLDPIEALRYE